MRFYFDIETCSTLDLTKVGSWLYARHPTTDIRCVSYCLVTDGARGAIETWMPGAPPPQTVFDFAADPDAEAVAFNNAFDRQIWERILTPRYNWPAIAFERHRCAQAATLARALPASLDAAAAALKIPTRKTKEGVAAMKRLAGPRQQSAKERKAGKPLDFSATPEQLAALAEYNRLDVLMTMEVVECIGLLPPVEQALWELDQQINERGVHVDIGLLETALLLEEAARRELHGQLAESTDGEITAPAQTQRILKRLAAHGCKIANLRKTTVTDALLEPGLDEQARQLLELRQSGAGAAQIRHPATLDRRPVRAPHSPCLQISRQQLRQIHQPGRTAPQSPQAGARGRALGYRGGRHGLACGDAAPRVRAPARDHRPCRPRRHHCASRQTALHRRPLRDRSARRGVYLRRCRRA
jgi:DNA polymerase